MHLLEHEFFFTPSEQSADARSHLLICAECRTRLSAASAFDARVPVMLRQVDRSPSLVTASSIMALSRGRVKARHARRRRFIIGGLTALTAASAAAAVPAVRARLGLSPWLSPAIPAVVAPSAARQTVPQPAPQPASVATASSGGVAFVPSGDVVVAFTTGQSAGVIRIQLTSTDQVHVTHTDGSADLALSSHGVVVSNIASTASYVVSIPRHGGNVLVKIGGRTVFSFDGNHVVTRAAADGPDAYRLDFSTLPGKTQ